MKKLLLAAVAVLALNGTATHAEVSIICRGQLWVFEDLVDVSEDQTGKISCYIRDKTDQKKILSVCHKGKPCTVEGDTVECTVDSGPSYQCIAHVRNITPRWLHWRF